jgi:hypothetical protein
MSRPAAKTAATVTPPAAPVVGPEPFVPATLTPIRTTGDIATVLVEIRDATEGIRGQMLTDVRRYDDAADLIGEGGDTLAQTAHANLATAVIVLADCVAALARVNA